MEDYKKRKLEETKQSLGATRDFEPMFPSSFSGALKTLDENTAKPIRYATNEAIKTGKPWEFFKGLAKSVTEEIPDVSGKEIAGNLGLSTKEYGNDPVKSFLPYSGSGISESPFKSSPAGMVGFGLENLLDAENLMPVGKAMAIGGLALGGLKKVGKELGENALEGGLKKVRNLDDMGFYSEMQDQIENMDFKSIPAQDLLNRLRKTVKPEELQFSGIEDYLKNNGGKVSKEDLNKFYEPIIKKTTETKKEYKKYTTKAGKHYKETLLFDKNNDYRSSHWEDKGVLSHYRSKQLPNKNYLIEEIQSDLHQEGRKKGYRRNINEQDIARLTKNKIQDYENQLHQKYGIDPQSGGSKLWYAMNEEEHGIMNSLKNEYGRSNAIYRDEMAKPPESPYKKTWPLMTFKSALSDAVQGGNDYISWVPGSEQAKRFSLSNTISEISYSGTNLKAFDHKGNEVISRTGVRPEELPEYIGKDVSEKLMSQEPKGTLRTISGLDLEVGGEGMKGFYDDILPKEVGKYVKKLDPEATVYQKEINTKNGPLSVWSVKLTDKIKGGVLGGQTRYSLAPVGPWMLYQQQKGEE